jgi:apolipoprotein N-acyltransferase
MKNPLPSPPAGPASATLRQRLLVASLLLLVLSAGLSYDMFRLGAAEQLWGYRPLFWLLSTWTAVVLLRQRWQLGRNSDFSGRPLLLATASGLLLGLGFPGLVPVPFFLWVGWVPLLILEAEWRQQAGARKRELLVYVFHALVLWNIVATYWVMNTSFAAGLFANFVNSFLMCLPWLLFLFTNRYMPKLGYASLVAYWLTFEYVHLNWELTWPWLTLGNGWAQYPSLVQWYTYTGVFGGSLWIWLTNLYAFQWWHTARQGQPTRTVAVKTLALVLLPLVVSVAIYASYQESGKSIDVVVVQPNYEPHYLKFSVPEDQQLDRILALSQPLLDSQVNYLVLPETTYGFVREEDVWEAPLSGKLYRALANYPQLKLVTGLNAYHDFRPGEPRTEATRERQRGGQTIEFEIMNLAAQMPLNREIPAQTYRKSKLVPGPEQFPFKHVFFFMESFVDDLGGTTAGLGIQPERSVFTSETANIAPVICYESIFGEYFTGYVRAGGQAAFIMTNDGWWDHTAGHRQHLYYASLRAIETRRGIARSANTGISAFINQRGDISQATRYNEAVAIRGQLTLNDAITFYVRWGDIIARIALFATIIFALNTFVKARIKK